MANLRDYFELDFPNTITVRYELNAVTVAENNQQEEIIFYAQAHIDFSSHVKFCSFYIPIEASESLFEMCKAALAYTRDVLALRIKGSAKMDLPKGTASITGQHITVEMKEEYVEIYSQPLEGGTYIVPDFIIAPPVYIYAEVDLSEKEKKQILDLGKRYNVLIRLRGPKYAMERYKYAYPIAFISHDHRDKDSIARPLAQGLTKLGFTVWFDEYTLKPGSRLRESIEKGMKECKKCILILTPNFLSNKGWTSTEFNMIFTREIIEEKSLVIPVWYGVSKEDVFQYSPTLLNVVGAHWNEQSPEKAIRDISRALDEL